MKSTPTPHTHTATTNQAITTTFGPTGSTQYTIEVPVGTRCVRLDGGSNPWVVQDLSFIQDKKSIMYSDADIYGIRIPEDRLVDIKSVG